MKLSIVVPAYNEESRIVPTLLDMRDYLEEQTYDYEIIVVVNGSTDQTFMAAKSLADLGMNKILVKELPVAGKGNAVKRGILDYSFGDIILFMDADNATKVSEIGKFFRYFQRGYDVVIGSRYLNSSLIKRSQPFYRVALSRLSNALIRLMAVPGVRDTQLGFKAFTQQAALDIFPLATVNNWAFDIEILAIARERGYNIKEVPVIWAEPGGSHVRLKAYWQSLRELFGIKRRMMSGKYQAPSVISVKGRGSAGADIKTRYDIM
ncbi:MAG: glycosyltransferase family 2 protein [Candidatus Doudnabacteria bacterium]|nr:glycosyltransferase family 2 protein [Candidatus Doudnabacteria bacterium]